MKLLMTADAVGGVWQYSLELARGLTRNGCEVLLATMGPRPCKQQRSDASSILGLHVVESDYALEWMQDPWQDVDMSGGWLQSLASSFGADLIHLNGYSHAALTWQQPVLVVAHSCVFSWWRAVHGEAPGDEWREYKRRVSAGLAAADAVVAPSRHMAASIQQEYRVPARKTHVLYNFSRAPIFDSISKRSFCLAAGRLWDQSKNLQLLERIAPEIAWPIRVAGPKQDPQTGCDIHSAIDLLGVMPHHQLMGHMRNSSIFLHPAVYEPFGLSVLEAARSGCALVLSDIPSLRELWEGAAIFADPRNPKTWQAVLERVISNASLRDELAALALQRSANYCAFRGVTEYLHLYEKLLGPRDHSEGVAA